MQRGASNGSTRYGMPARTDSAKPRTAIPIINRTTRAVYFFENNDLSTAVKQDLNDCGAYCAFELEICAFEASLWRQYLQSDMAMEDKEKYLSDFNIAKWAFGQYQRVLNK